MSYSETIKIAQSLIREVSVSPEDGDCQRIMADYLSALGFKIEPMPFGPVNNLWARRGEMSPLFVFAGHTDVVPTGPIEEWIHPPFEAVAQDGVLHGRGAADMKGSLAAMMTAVSRFIADNPDHQGSIAFLITSDEEDIAVDGTVRVMDELDARGTKLDYCVVGEPSSSKQLGDVIRVGRRGSLNGRLTVKGIQGHVAYPADARNPIIEAAPALAEIAATTWDDGNEFFPATSFQISNVSAGTGASNVIPGEMVVDFNFRFSTESTEQSLRARTEAIIKKHVQDWVIDWKLSGPPFLTEHGTLIPNVQKTIADQLGRETELSTSGGTSDGRFIAPRGVELVELGPCNSTIHKINEQTSIEELDQLSELYEGILKAVLMP